MIAGNETENVVPSNRLSNKTVAEQKITFGDVSECVYRGRNSMNKVNTKMTENSKEMR